jgi:hypothetical protein
MVMHEYIALYKRKGFLLLLVSFMLVNPATALALNIITDGNMEAPNMGSWLHDDITGVNSSMKATDQSASGQSLKGISETGNGIDVEWYNKQTVGIIDSTDTVLLSLWWAYQYNNDISGGGVGSLIVDIQPTSSGSWTTVFARLTSSVIGSDSSTESNRDISSSFTTTDISYDIRLGFAGRTGNSNTSNINVWWDDVELDVTPIPEPATLLLFGTGLVGVGIGTRRRRKES